MATWEKAGVYTVDVKFSNSTAVADRNYDWAHGEDWHRFFIYAENGLEAELIACQWIYSRPKQTPVWSCVVDWP